MGVEVGEEEGPVSGRLELNGDTLLENVFSLKTINIR